MKRRIKNPSLLNEMLEMHDIFNHMLGNPTSITMLAHIHQNKLTKIKLADMYQKIKDEKNNAFIGEDMNASEGNLISLSVAAEMSVKLLEPYPDDINLLYLLGNLPAGLEQEEL